MAFFGVRLSDDLAVRFDVLAARKGGRSKVLRGLIEAAAKAEGLGSAEAPQPLRSRSDKLTLRLKLEELADLQRQAAEAGMHRTEWAAALLRQRLTGAPQFRRDQAQALLDVRRDLRRISVNVNTAVQAVVDAGPGSPEAAAQLAELRAFQVEVREQLQAVREGLQGNLAYWNGER